MKVTKDVWNAVFKDFNDTCFKIQRIVTANTESENECYIVVNWTRGSERSYKQAGRYSYYYDKDNLLAGVTIKVPLDTNFLTFTDSAGCANLPDNDYLFCDDFNFINAATGGYNTYTLHNLQKIPLERQ